MARVTRTGWLIAIAGTVCLAAVALRIHSHRARPSAPATQPTRSADDQASLPMPRDYVVDPWVHPDEADAGPARIVSLAPSVTEIVCALGLRDRLVGRTPYCTHPPDVRDVLEVGALDATNFNRIKALGPDLVLTTSNSRPTVEGLERLNLRYAAVPHESLGQLYAAIERIGALCDRPRTAGGLVVSIRADLEALQDAARDHHAEPLGVLVALGPLPVPPRPVWVAGPGLFLDELVTLAGHRNAAAAVLQKPQGELPLEKLITLDADVILTFGPAPTPEDEADLYRSWESLAKIPAIRDRQVRRAGGKEWLSAGPRVAIAFRHTIAALSDNP
jgi:iron complex transport system substrate-binding protein